MASYRLLSGLGAVVETFDVDTAEAAVTYGRQRAHGHLSGLRHHGIAKAVALSGFRVERQQGDEWVFVHAWGPTPRTTPLSPE